MAHPMPHSRTQRPQSPRRPSRDPRTRAPARPLFSTVTVTSAVADPALSAENGQTVLIYLVAIHLIRNKKGRRGTVRRAEKVRVRRRALRTPGVHVRGTRWSARSRTRQRNVRRTLVHRTGVCTYNRKRLPVSGSAPSHSHPPKRLPHSQRLPSKGIRTSRLRPPRQARRTREKLCPSCSKAMRPMSRPAHARSTRTRNPMERPKPRNPAQYPAYPRRPNRGLHIQPQAPPCSGSAPSRLHPPKRLPH